MPVEEREGGLVERAQVRVGLCFAAGRRATFGLGEVERPIGHLDQRVLVAAVLGEAGDPDADVDVRRAGPVRQLGDRAPDAYGDLVGDAPIGTGQDRDEFVAAVAIEQVAVARGVGQRLRHAHQERIAGGVAAGVVEGLEPVEVEHEDRERPPAAAVRDRLAELTLERSVVAQTGQRIEIGSDANGPVRLGVLERDRRLAGEQLGQLELVRR